MASKATSASIGTDLLNGALGGLAGIAANLAIDLIITGITNLINAQENAIKRADEALSNLKDNRESLKSNKSTIDEISGDYERLASGVDRFGRNISLSADEYARYNDIVNQIAEMFPQMVQGYTAEGNAIISQKGNVEALTKAYEAQKRAALEASVESANDVFNGYKAAVDYSYWGNRGDYTESKLIGDIVSANQGSTIDEGKLKKALRAYGGTFEVSGLLRTMGYEFTDETLSFQEAGDYSSLIAEDPSKILAYYQSLVAKVNAETAKVKPIALDYVSLQAADRNLSAEKEDALRSIVAQMGSDFFNQFDNSDELFASISKGLMSKFEGPEGQELAKSFNEFFQVKDALDSNEMSVGNYLESYHSIIQKINLLPEETRQNLKEALNLDENGVKIDDMLQKVGKKFSKGVAESLSLDELQIAYKVVDKTKYWKDVKQKIAEVKRAALSLQDVYDNLAAPLGQVSQAQDLFSQALSEQESQGVVTAETLDQLIRLNGDYAQCLEDNGGRLTLNSKKFKELTDSQLETAKAQTDAELAGTLWAAALNGSNEELDNQIAKLTVLSSQYEYATSNLKAWRDAQSGPDKGDLYSEGESAYAALKKGLESGDIGTNQYKAAEALLIPQEVLDEGGERLAQYRGMLETFFSDENQAVEIGWEKLGDLVKGEGLNKTLVESVDISQVAEVLGVTKEMAQMWVDMAEKKGYVFNFDDTSILHAENAVKEIGETFRSLNNESISTEEAQTKIDQIAEQLKNIPEETLATVGLRVVEEDGKQVLKTLEGGITISADADFDTLKKSLAAVNVKIGEDGNTVKIPFLIEDQEALKDLEDFMGKLDKVPSRKSTSLYVYRHELTVSDPRTKHQREKEAQLIGAHFVSGTGITGVPETGNVLVGEEAPEMYVSRKSGRWKLVGMLGAEFIRAEKGDIIFNAQQTRSLLNNGFAASRGRAYAGGSDAFLDFGSGRYTSHTDWSKWSVTGSRSPNRTVYLKPKVEDKDVYLADINELYEAEVRLKELENREGALEHSLKMTDSLSEQVQLTRQLNENYRQQQEELHAANERRDELIKANVEKLRNAGFNVYYDPVQNRLMIANMEHINQLMGGTQEKTNALRKEYEELISETEKLNDANHKSSEEWRKHAEAIRKNNLEIVEKVLKGYDEFISYADDFDLWNNMDVSKLDILQAKMEYLTQAFAQGLISAQEFKEQTREIGKDIYKEQKKALEDIIDLTEDLIKQETKDRVQGLKDQISAYEKIIDLKKKALQDEADEKDYAKEQEKKLKEIAKLQAQIDRLALDDSLDALYERQALEEELAEKQKELADFQADHAREAQIDALDEEAKRYKEVKDKEIEEAEAAIDTEVKLREAAMKRIDSSGEQLKNDLINYAKEYKDSIDGENSVTSAWKTATEAMQKYGSYAAALQGIKSESVGGSNYSTISGIVSQMRHNSNLWGGASQEERNRLAKQNEEFAARIQDLLQGEGKVTKENGTWYFTDKNGQKQLLYDVYHEGGVVGGNVNVRDDEVFALLQNGELVLSRNDKKTVYEVIDFAREMQERFGANLTRLSDSHITVPSPALYEAALKEVPTAGDTVFSPTINVEFHHQGDMKESDAVRYGNLIANTALDSLQSMFTKSGVSTHRFAGLKQ